MIPPGLIASVLRVSTIAIIPFVIWIIGRFGSKKVWYFQTSSTSIAFGVARFWYYVSPFITIAFLCFGVDDYYLDQNPHETSVWLYIGTDGIAHGRFIPKFIIT